MNPPTTNLQPGMTGTEVKKLQDYLVSQGFMTQAQVDTGYGIYGPRTTAAVQALQESLGVDNSSGPGYWGPKTIQAVSTPTQTTSAPTDSSIVQFNPDTGAKLAEGQSVVSGGITYTQGQPVPMKTVSDSGQVDMNTVFDIPQYGSNANDKATVPQIAAKLGVSVEDFLVANPRYKVYTPNQVLSLSFIRDNWGGLKTPSAKSPVTSDLAINTTSNIASQYGLTGESAQLVNLFQTYLDKLATNGQSINPNIEITPDRVSEFMAKAQSDIDQFIPYASKEIKPFYENQLKVAREGFLRSAGYSQQQLLQHEAGLERKFTETQRGIGEQAAEQGFAQSGLRFRQERENIDATQRAIGQARETVGQRVTGLASEFAQKYGTANLPGFNVGATPKVGDFDFTRPSAEQPFYQLSPETYAGLQGEQTFAQESATRKRAAELESAFRSKAAVDQQRQLTL